MIPFDPWRFGLDLALLDSNDYFAAYFQRMHVFRFCCWSQNWMWPASQKPVWSIAHCLWGESAGPLMFWVFHYLDFFGCVAAATFLPKSLKFWGPSFPFKAALIPFDPWRFGLALALFDSNDYLRPISRGWMFLNFVVGHRTECGLLVRNPSDRLPIVSEVNQLDRWCFEFSITYIFRVSFMLNRGL